MAKSDSVYSEEHDRVNRGTDEDDQHTRKELKSLQEKLDRILAEKAKQEQLNSIGNQKREKPARINQVDGLEGQEELCFINSNGHGIGKSPTSNTKTTTSKDLTTTINKEVTKQTSLLSPKEALLQLRLQVQIWSPCSSNS